MRVASRERTVPHSNVQQCATPAAARRRRASSSNSRSGSKLVQRPGWRGASKPVLAPMPDPTSSASPRRKGTSRSRQYRFQLVACAKTSSSDPPYLKSTIAFPEAALRVHTVESLDEQLVVAKRDEAQIVAAVQNEKCTDERYDEYLRRDDDE